MEKLKLKIQMNKNFTVKNTMYISLKVIILFLFFITQGYAKNLPPGSGEGDLPANVLILLDKSEVWVQGQDQQELIVGDLIDWL